MKNKHLASLIAKAAALADKIELLQEQKKALEVTILDAAKALPVEERTASGAAGWSLTLPGRRGIECRVNSATPSIEKVTEIRFAELQAMYGKAPISALWPKAIHSPVDKFRDVAAVRLGDRAAALIAAVEADPRVSLKYERPAAPKPFGKAAV